MLDSSEPLPTWVGHAGVSISKNFRSDWSYELWLIFVFIEHHYGTWRVPTGEFANQLVKMRHPLQLFFFSLTVIHHSQLSTIASPERRVTVINHYRPFGIIMNHHQPSLTGHCRIIGWAWILFVASSSILWAFINHKSYQPIWTMANHCQPYLYIAIFFWRWTASHPYKPSWPVNEPPWRIAMNRPAVHDYQGISWPSRLGKPLY